MYEIEAIIFKETEQKKVEEEIDKKMGNFKDNLVFKKKNISIFLLYYNISGALK